MKSPSSLGESEYCAIVFGAGGQTGGTFGNIRNHGGHGFRWDVPTGVTEARFYVAAQGSGGGAVNCCGYTHFSTPGLTRRAVVVVLLGSNTIHVKHTHEHCKKDAIGRRRCARVLILPC